MKQTKAAHRYAKSFLSLSKEQNVVDATQEDMAFVVKTIHASHDLHVMLQSPVIKTDKKLAVLAKVFAGNISDISQKFIALIVDKGRGDILKLIAKEYVTLCKEGNQIFQADVVSAYPLTTEQRAQIMEMGSKMQAGTFEITETIDQSLIGGFVLKIGDQMIDASLKKQLRNMRQEMTSGAYVS